MSVKSLANNVNDVQTTGNYTNEQQSFGPRSYGNMGNDLNQQYPPQASGDEYKRYLNQNIKQII